MKVIQSYQQGARHISNDQPCEDRTFYLSDNDVEVIALADGAGSQKFTHSAEGAECVTETMCRFFCNNFDKFYEKSDIEELKAVIVAVCHKKLSEKADELNLDSIARLSSTLLVVAIKQDKVIACHIGDGVIGKLTDNGTEIVSAPDNGEFASTTYFITSPLANEHLKIIKENVENAYSYFLMSDGTSEYVYDNYNKSFYGAARKMALLAYSENGQEKLEETIKKYMIEGDSRSDDCSFICIPIKEQLENNETGEEVVNAGADSDSKSDTPPSDLEDEEKASLSEKNSDAEQSNKYIINAVNDFSKANNSNGCYVNEKRNKNNFKKIVIIAVSVFVVVFVSILICLQNSSKASLKKPATTEKVITSVVETSTSEQTEKDKTTQSTSESTEREITKNTNTSTTQRKQRRLQQAKAIRN